MNVNIKDLINVGIFTVVYFIMFTIAGMLGYIPILVIALPFIAGVLGGIPFILFLIKEQKFGAITIMGTLTGILCFLMGQHWLSIIFGIVCALIADLICKSGSYKSWKKNMIGYSVFTMWTIGSMLPMWIIRESFFAAYSEKGGTPTYINAVMNLTHPYMIPVIIVLGIIGAIIGAYLGKATLKKHFIRAGIV